MRTANPARPLREIVASIDRIHAHVAGMDAAAFMTSGVAREEVDRCLVRISEAAITLDTYMDARYPAVPWANVRAMGFVLHHDMDAIDSELVWELIRTELPLLRMACDMQIRKIRG